MSKKYKMVSLDTSTTKTGWAYWENGTLKESGIIDYSKEKDSEIRVEDMCFSILEILKKFSPETIVIEMTVVTRNANVQRILSEIVGVVRGYALINYCEFIRLRPTEWRKLVKTQTEVTPKKREELKNWSINKVLALYKKKVSDDEADAILLGQARINQFVS